MLFSALAIGLCACAPQKALPLGSLAPGSDGDAADAPTITRSYNDVKEDGSYTFGFEASDGTFKIETKDLEGNVRGE